MKLVPYSFSGILLDDRFRFLALSFSALSLVENRLAHGFDSDLGQDSLRVGVVLREHRADLDVVPDVARTQPLQHLDPVRNFFHDVAHGLTVVFRELPQLDALVQVLVEFVLARIPYEGLDPLCRVNNFVYRDDSPDDPRVTRIVRIWYGNPSNGESEIEKTKYEGATSIGFEVNLCIAEPASSACKVARPP